MTMINKLIIVDLIYFPQYVVLCLIAGSWVFAEYVENNYTINFSDFKTMQPFTLDLLKNCPEKLPTFETLQLTSTK